jgi:hypothetical protein
MLQRTGVFMSRVKSKLGIPKDASPEDFVHIAEAHAIFGRGYSRRSIEKLIDKGVLTLNIHYINDAPPWSSNRIIKLYIPAINALRSGQC